MPKCRARLPQALAGLMRSEWERIIAEANFGDEDATYMHRDEMQPRRSERQAGYASSEVGPMDRETVRKWVGKMRNADGSTGGHWNYDQTSQILRQRGYQHGPDEWYAILNAMYSDYCTTARQFGVDNVDFYASMAHDWLDDDDAKDGKAERYYCYIVEK